MSKRMDYGKPGDPSGCYFPREWRSPCRSCRGLGYLPATYSRGAIPCGCDEPSEDDDKQPGTPEGVTPKNPVPQPNREPNP